MPYVIKDGANKVTTVFNNPIEGVTEWVEPNDPALEYFELTNQKKKEINDERPSRLVSVTSGGKTYPVSGDNFYATSCRIVKGLIDSDANISVPDIDYDYTSLSAATASALLDSMNDYIMAVNANYVSLKTAIDDAVDLAALQAVDTGAGWPSSAL